MSAVTLHELRQQRVVFRGQAFEFPVLRQNEGCLKGGHGSNCRSRLLAPAFIFSTARVTKLTQPCAHVLCSQEGLQVALRRISFSWQHVAEDSIS